MNVSTSGKRSDYSRPPHASTGPAQGPDGALPPKLLQARAPKPHGFAMSKQAMREETERLIKEAMEKKKLTITQGDTQIDTNCGKCGAPNRNWCRSGCRLA